MMKIKLIALALGLMLSANLKAQTAQDFKQTYADLSVFEDPLALTLKKGIKKKQLNQIADTTLRRVAQSIFDGNYSKDYKYATYYALLSPTTLGHQLSIGDGYSKYENMTGVYLPKGKHIVIVDGIPAGKEVNLVVPNWLRKAPNPQEPTKEPKGWGLEKQEFRLQNGVNIIQLNDYGSLAYIGYFSDEPEKESPITVHFPTGQVNGYFDLKKPGQIGFDGFL